MMSKRPLTPLIVNGKIAVEEGVVVHDHLLGVRFLYIPEMSGGIPSVGGI